MKNVLQNVLTFIIILLIVGIFQALTFDNKIFHRVNINPNRAIMFNVGVNNDSVEQAIIAIQALNLINNEPIFLMLNSSGGSVFAGERLITAMESSKAPVYTIANGGCASMCAYIHSHGYRRYIIDRGYLMFHPASTKTEGKVKEIKSYIDFLDAEVNKLDYYVADRAGISREKWENIIAHELWVSSDLSKELKLVDNVVAVNFTKARYAVIPNKRDTVKSSKNVQKTEPTIY